MSPSAAPTDRLYEASLRQGRLKHAVKTALACCLATGLVYFFHLKSGEFAPVFVFMLMSIGMPTPRLNWLLAQTAIVISALVSAILLLAFHPDSFLYIVLTLLWIFTCLLFSTRVPLPATMGAMVSAIGIFVVLHGTVEETLLFYVRYALDYLVAGFSVVTVHTLLWPVNTRGVFLQRLAQVYAHFEARCRQAAGRIRSGDPPTVAASPEQWAPFRELRQFLAPELRRARATPNPFSQMILACRSLNLRLWFFNESIAPLVSNAIRGEARERLTSRLERQADLLHELLEAALQKMQVPLDATQWGDDIGSTRGNSAPFRSEGEVLLAQGIHETVLRRVGKDIGTVARSHNLLLDSLGRSPAERTVTSEPAITHTRLLDLQAVRAAAKLVLIITLLLVAEAIIGLPGGSQVAFYAAFFASTGNLGRQNKTDLIGLAGLVSGFVYGVVAAFVTSHVAQVPLLLGLVFLGELLASLAFQTFPAYSAAGFQAGLALPFAYLASSGPEWGSFALAQTRFAGLVLAGFVALVIHAYVWPVLPMHQLRASIAAALRDTATSLEKLFGATRATWTGPPASLIETVRRAPDLLDDARYLPGADHADPAYHEILRSLQEMDANLEYLDFLIGLEPEHALRLRFFQAIGDYAGQARTNLEHVAKQFQNSTSQAARVDAIHWSPDVSGKWEEASGAIRVAPNAGIDPARPAVLAHCLDQIAQATERVSRIVWEINVRNIGAPWSASSLAQEAHVS